MATEEKTLQTWDLPVDCGEGKKIEFRLTQIEEVKEEEPPPPPPKKNYVPIILKMTIGITVMVILFLKGYPFLRQHVGYYYAQSRFGRQEYAQAKQWFDSLGDYKDCQEKSTVCTYNMAYKAEKDSDYKKAWELYHQIESYKDAKDRAWICNYGMAQELFDAGKYQQAKEKYLAMGSYKNCAKKALACDYALAEEVYEQQDYEKAKSMFESLGEFKDSPQRAKDCVQGLGTQAMAEQDYEKALAYLDETKKDEKIEAMMEECNYQLGLKAMENGQEEDAISCFRQAGDYSDARIQYENLIWKHGYTRVIEQLQSKASHAKKQELGRELCIALDYLDGDSIPELLVSYTNPDYEDQVYIYTMRGEEAVSLKDKDGKDIAFGANGTVQYVRKSGEILDAAVRDGYAQITTYQMDGCIAEETCHMMQGKAMVINGVTSRYAIDQKPVDQHNFQAYYEENIRRHDWIREDCTRVIPQKYETIGQALDTAQGLAED